MNNRSLSFPALWLLALSLTLSPCALHAAEAAAPGDTNAAPMQATPAEGPVTSTSAPVAAPADTTAERPATYTVVSGDTLWAISHKFDCSIRQLKKLNHLTKNNLKPGQVLKIPAAKA